MNTMITKNKKLKSGGQILQDTQECEHQEVKCSFILSTAGLHLFMNSLL